ncbi:MAG: SpoIIE family protein phosphatase, partial [Bacteroidia bacterium]
ECSNLNNLGGVFFDLKKYDSSLVYLHRSLAISEEMKDTVGLADAYGNMGAVYILLKDTVNAVKYSLLGVRYSILSGNNYQLFTSYNNIAQAMLMNKNYKEAERYALMSLSISEKLGALEGSRGNYKSLADIYKEKGEHEKANMYLEKFIAVNDSLISEARMKQLTGLEAKYQSAKKDKELIEERSASERKSTLLYGLIIGLILVIALAVFVYRGYHNKKKFLGEMTLAKREIEIKSLELESRNKDVTDSINYARKIQSAVLPNEETFYKSIPSSFILYKPKDIVSGDFFWFHEIDQNNYILVCGDCTGHGVPGALMTVVGCNLLNRVVADKQVHEPARILYEMDGLLNITLKQDTQSGGVQDGMDLSLLKINKVNNELIISSARRPFVIVQKGQLKDFKGGRYSLGGIRSGEKRFEEIKVNYESGDMLYFFTDGYGDQFGGEKGKKFSSKRLKDFLYSISKKDVSVQKEILDNEISNWKGSLEQVDDICVIGIRL